MLESETRRIESQLRRQMPIMIRGDNIRVYIDMSPLHAITRKKLQCNGRWGNYGW